MKKQLLLFAMILLPLVASAGNSGTCGENLTWKYDESTNTLTISGTGPMTSYYYNDTPWNAFKQDIKAIIIEHGVSSISQYAFRDCFNIATVEIPSSVKSIGNQAFYDCLGLQKVVVSDIESWCNISFAPEWSNPLIYSHRLFIGADEVKELVIPNTVYSIPNGAFAGLSYITSLVIPSSVTSIGTAAFEECKSIKTVEIPNSITKIESHTFMNCSGIISLKLPNNLSIIGDWAFKGCSGLTTLELPNSVTSLGLAAFQDCNNLVKIKLSESLTEIGEQSFAYCEGLYSLVIPNSVKYIGNNAFLGCSGLTSVILGNNVLEIGDASFALCKGLTAVTLPKSVTKIGSSFSHCESLKTISLNEGLKTIGRSAFWDCISLESIVIPQSVTSLGAYAFAICSSLTEIEIPEGITELEAGTFERCSNLKNVKLHDKISKISSTYPQDLNSVCGVFYSCSSLEQITLPKNITLLDKEVFKSCSSLKSLIIPESVSSIGDAAFYGCHNLSALEIPNNVKSIGEQAFYKCTGLKNISLPSEINVIKKECFLGCQNIKSIVIPASVEVIYQEAFKYCSFNDGVKVFAENPPFAYDNTFSNFEVPLYVPETSVSKYKETSPWNNFSSIKNLSGDDTEKKKCAIPIIKYDNGQISFDCETKEVEFSSNISNADVKNYNTSIIQLGVTYIISVYATKSGYLNSDVATATLCWIDQQPKTEGVTNGIANIPAQAVLIQSEGGSIKVQGVDEGTQVNVYSINGTQAGSAISQSGAATINTNLQPGSIAIVKIGQKSVKLVIK